MLTTDQYQAARFFYEHSGYSWNPDTETPEVGRRRGALRLAHAEAAARGFGWTVEWVDDWSLDHEREFDCYEDGHAMVVFGASAFRDEYVSVSGGPCPAVDVSELVYIGETEQRFWRWKDRPRAGGGIDYVMTVSEWAWAPRESCAA